MIIDRQRRQSQPGTSRDLPVSGMAVSLDGQRPDSPAAQDLAQQLKPLGEAGAHHNAVRRRDDAASTRHILSDRHAQDLQAARAGVAEVAGRRRRQRPPRRGEPGRAREQGQIGSPGTQIVARAAGRRTCPRQRSRRLRPRALGDPRARSVPGRKPALCY